jgi:hypothetical protein
MITTLWTALLGLVCSLAAACSSPSDPFTTGDGHASVQGLVTGRSGSALSNTGVFVACEGASTVATRTDASGRYLINLDAPAASLNANGSQLRCHFTEPNASSPRAQKDTVLGFGRGPVLVPLQMVDLQEQ